MCNDTEIQSLYLVYANGLFCARYIYIHVDIQFAFIMKYSMYCPFYNNKIKVKKN